MDYKIIDLCKQIEPREQDIILLSSRRSDMKLEIKNYDHQLANLKSEYQSILLKHCGTLREKISEESKRKYTVNMGRQVMTDFMQIYNEYKKLKKVSKLKIKLIDLHHKLDKLKTDPPEIKNNDLPKLTSAELLSHLEHSTHDTDHQDKDIIKNGQELESGIKRIQLEKTIQMLEKQIKKEEEKRYHNAEKISEEGAILTQ